MVELVLLDYRYVINYTLLFVAAKWTLSESGLLTAYCVQCTLKAGTAYSAMRSSL